MTAFVLGAPIAALLPTWGAGKMTEKVHVEFTVKAGSRELFLKQLDSVTGEGADHSPAIVECLGYRADDYVARREALVKFVDQMELVLRKHDHKTSWRDRPIEALVRLFMLEIEEFKCALEFFEVKEARKELIDCANYCLIVSDRLSLLDQERNAKEQTRE